jgi:dienelactone hydrolase
MRKIIAGGILAALLTAQLGAMTPTQRQDYLSWMLQTLPDNPPWTDWQKSSGELPPDFDALPRQNTLPDPFRFLDGRTVKKSDWPARRAEIRQLYEKYDIGSLPPRPKLDNIVPLEETTTNGYRTRSVRLEYGPDHKATTQVTVTLPPGPGPFPVLIGGGSFSSLLRRGYISCSYSGSVDQVSNLPQLYPNYDFATMGQRAWTAQLVVDYLYTLPEVDHSRIAITGYSREGKMATIAAAMDDRIAAVIAGSTGVGGILPWRLSGERGTGEGIETTTRMFPLWFAPRLRFFSGREDRLPIDANLLVSMIAPRAILMEYGLNDEVSNTWGSEQTYKSAVKVYDLLGQHDRIGILRVPGFHGANDTDACLDWLDIQFGRSTRTWTNNFLYHWDFAEWTRLSHEAVNLSKFPKGNPDLLASANGAAVSTPADWEKKAGAIRENVQWVLGDASPVPPAPAGRGFAGRAGAGPAPGPTVVAKGGIGNPGQLLPDVPAWVIGRGGQEFGWLEPEKNEVDSRKFRFGSGLSGDFYYPAKTPANTKLPTVIWLHGYSYPLGYMWVYRRDLHPILALVKAGYAVLAYDQCGFGSRMGEIGPFYDRYPHWSQLGRMVEDARSAIDALQKDALVDPDKISLFGYTLGAAVGLHVAALDSRVKGVVAVAGFTPMRTDTPDKGTSGTGRYSEARGIAPRLGFFVGHEAQIPYDYSELIGLIAPRPVLVVQPQLDREATSADVAAAVEQARRVYSLYGASAKLGLDSPNDIARLPTATQDRAIQWMRQNF